MKYKFFDEEQESNAKRVCVNESRILYSKLVPLIRVC